MDVPVEPDQNDSAEVPLRLVHDVGSVRLRRRRFETIPLRGPGTAHTMAQGRLPADVTTPVELADLISSISEIGVLQPILVEELPSETGPPRLLVVAGERRLRACRWGAAHQGDNEHFHGIPAIICPGPLSDEERRIWQLIENLAREPLRPGEQAAGLLLQRCAILVGKLLRAGRPVPADVYDIADPVERFTALERLRAGDPACAAPWAEVLSRLGLQLSPRKARELVRAFAAMPRALSEEMDENKVSLHTRIRFAELRHGREAAADEIWAAVKDRRRPELFAATIAVTAEDPALGADKALDAAADRHAAANLARAEKLSRSPGARTPSETVIERQDHCSRETTTDARDGAASSPPPGPASQEAPGDVRGVVDRELARRALVVLRDLAAGLRDGHRLSRYDAGSLGLMLTEVTQLISRGGPS